MAGRSVSTRLSRPVFSLTHNLKLNGYDPEIQHLYSWPDHIIGLQGGQVDVLKLPSDSTLPTPFGDRHECEKAC